MANSIELKTINEMLGMNFFIPSYQRGYRWTKQQVNDLLNDIWEFKPEKINNTDEYTWYCLQPLVVKEDENQKDKYHVIDGQQRLTTIFIILNCLDDKNNCEIKYQTRPDSTDFIKNIKNKSEADDINIDFHFMLEAQKSIKEWKVGKDIQEFLKKLKENCKVIWYPISETESAYEVFKRLNSGKLSLSNAELIKALLLNKENFIGDDEKIHLKQLEMAGEWDRIEQTLHEDSFWYFINPDPESSKYKATRIDFIFEMALLCRKENEIEYKKLDENLKSNRYFIFNEYSSQCLGNDGYSSIWSEIIKVYRRMRSWYNNRQLYHYIGYLMNLKGSSKVETLIELLKLAEDMSKDEFLKYVIYKCQKSIQLDKDDDKKQQLNLYNLEYGSNNNEIHNILLLFNLATTQNQISEDSRYPFNEHYQAAQKKWSLEHIHAQNERKADWSDDEIERIKYYLNNIIVHEIAQKQIVKNLSNIITKESLKDGGTYNAVIGALMGAPLYEDNTVTPSKFSSTFNKDDTLKNLALLQGDKNASFNNKLYPEKKELLAKWENARSETLFIPICTRNVFFKHYSPSSANPLMWDAQAGEEYLNSMVETISSYLGLEAIEKERNKKFGLKIKE